MYDYVPVHYVEAIPTDITSFRRFRSSLLGVLQYQLYGQYSINLQKYKLSSS